jgi:hypothetical protein
MTEILVNRILYLVPESWNALGKRAYLKVCGILSSTESDARKDVKLLKYLMGIKLWFANWDARSRNIIKLPALYKQTLLYDKACLGWLRENASVSDYKVRGFWHRGKYYVGPPERMLAITGIELVSIRTFLIAYRQTKDSKYVDMMVATIFRPKNLLWWLQRNRYAYNGDKRMPLNQYSMERRAAKFEKLHGKYKMAIFLQITGASEAFEAQYKYVFGRVAEGQPQNIKAWMELLFELSGGKFGNYNETEKTDADTLFSYLDYSIKKHREDERRRKLNER